MISVPSIGNDIFPTSNPSMPLKANGRRVYPNLPSNANGQGLIGGGSNAQAPVDLDLFYRPAPNDTSLFRRPNGDLYKRPGSP